MSYAIRSVGWPKWKMQGAGWSASKAEEVLGPKAWDNVTSLTAFAYLYHRFGPPKHGCDDYKDIAGYTLTTPDPDVRMAIYPGAAGIALTIGYRAKVSLWADQTEASTKWEEAVWSWYAETTTLTDESDPKDISEEYWRWRLDPAKMTEAKAKIGDAPDFRALEDAVKTRIDAAMTVALRRLLRPVWVRDMAFNLLGPMEGR